MTAQLCFVQGTLDVLVLRALVSGPLHGHGVARFIHSASRGSFRVLDGALYTALHRLDSRGWVESEWGQSDARKRARFYRLTKKGRRALNREMIAWEHYTATVALVLAAAPNPSGISS